MPIYAECGGLMYLTRSITEFDGNKHAMVNLFDADTIMDKKLTLNYTDAKVVNPCILGNAGKSIHGHEFHYSKIEDTPKDARFAYQLKKGKGINGDNDGLIEHNTLASYMHLHFANRHLAENLLQACRKYSKR
jgi:cobyrinic acid a,c-diamide synthase